MLVGALTIKRQYYCIKGEDKMLNDFNCGGLDDGFGCEVGVATTPTVQKISVEAVLSLFKSGISFDIAKNHIGVCIWDGKTVTVDGFSIEYDYDNEDYLAEAKMRLWLKNRCAEYFVNKHFEVCQVEGTYGGVNYDTNRKLIVLNSVVAELIVEGRADVENYFNLILKEWLKDFKRIVKVGKSLTSKYEIQEILKFMEFPFAVENADKSNSYKLSIYYEDICDAVGMLCGLAMRLKDNKRVSKPSSVRLSNVRFKVIEDMDFLYELGDEIIESNSVTMVDIGGLGVEDFMLKTLKGNESKVFVTLLKNKDLGRFAINNGIPYFDSEQGYIIFYSKEIKKYLRKK